jgi:hypothetical protein
MPTLAVTHIFAPATLIESAEANQNFDDIEAWANTHVIQKDASVAFTAVPSGPASDPVTANQFTRKAYVDKWKVLDRDESFTLSAALPTGSVLPGLSLTFTAAADRLYMVVASFQVHSGVDAGWTFHLREDGNVIRRLGVTNGDTVGIDWLDGMIFYTPNAGAHTLTILADRYAGAGDMQLGGSNTPPIVVQQQFWVADIGLRA